MLAEEFGYSKEYISRTFSKYVGAMPRYINRLRVQKARRMLAEGGRTVIETAFLCGFESPNTFYRAYKDAFGTPPKTAPTAESEKAESLSGADYADIAV